MKLWKELIDWDNCNLSDFCKLPIRRRKGIAEIIIAYYNFDEKKPIPLFGFRTSSEKSDFDIREEAYLYFRDLNKELQPI
jgi:hypothetical protein